MAPAVQIAKSASVHSYRVLLMIATRCPRPIPEAISPLATALTSARKSAFVTSTQVPDDSVLKATASGARVALRTGRSERFPLTCGVTSGGTEMLFTKILRQLDLV